MAESRAKKQSEPETPEEATPKEAVKEAEPASDSEEIPVERLISEGGAFLGQEPHVVAGALAGVNRKKLTVEEAQAAVDAWLKQPVKEDE